MSAQRSDDEDAAAGGFWRNWSRRKRATRRAEARDIAAETAAPLPELDATEAVAGGSDAAEPADLSALPAVDEITATTDIRPFMRPGIPAALRAAALRRAWSLSRHVRDYADPAVDYAWDWNAPGGVPGGGGTLGGQSVRKMVADIFKEPTPEAPSATAADDRRHRPAAPDADTAKTEMARAPEPPPAAAPAPAPASPASPIAAPPVVASHRHGSARPVFDDNG